MKYIARILIVVFIFEFVAMVVLAYAGDVTLAWDSNEEPDVIGYNLYFKNHINEDYRLSSEMFEQDFDNPLFPSTTIWGLSNSLTYYFVATAFSNEKESGYSNEVIWTYKEPKIEPNKPPTNNNGGSGGGGCFISSVQ